MQEVSLNDVLEYWVKNYQVKKGERIINWDTVLDPVAKRVVFKLTIVPEETPPSTPQI